MAYSFRPLPLAPNTAPSPQCALLISGFRWGGDSEEGLMSWENEDLQRYFRNLLQAFEERNSIESQQILRTRRGEMARTEVISGMHLARMATEFAGKTLYEPAMYTLDAFDEASQALNMRSTENDYRSLEAHVEQGITRSEPGVSSRIQSEYRLIAQMCPCPAGGLPKALHPEVPDLAATIGSGR
jgi:hypothetical protein